MGSDFEAMSLSQRCSQRTDSSKVDVGSPPWREPRLPEPGPGWGWPEEGFTKPRAEAMVDFRWVWLYSEVSFASGLL